ncbi:MAG: response regulator transcription factor [Microcoleaceae cyanobacterium]
MSLNASLRILLVEDDELFRLGLSTRLQRESGFEIVAETGDGDVAIELTNQYRPDVVLLDIGLPGIGGIEACVQIKQRHPHLAVLVLTSHSQKQLIERLIAAGADGYCLKGIDAENLVLALRSVVSGASWWDQRSTTEIRAVFARKSINSAPQLQPLETPLTHREQEVLALIACGKANQEIAQELSISVGTVRVHVHVILQKLDVRDRTQAAIIAIQRGIIS